MRNIEGKIVDVVNRRIFDGVITIENGVITEVKETNVSSSQYILPGLVDAHIHIESSMLVPSEFAKLATVHGTIATVSDPHEIANVLGIDGVEFMIDNSRKVPLKFNFGAPSCVPATPFETAGAEIDAAGIEYLLKKNEVKYLAEMMNWPGVLNHDPLVMDKIAIAKKLGKPVDGHAPGLKGELAEKYISAGIYTDHECFTMEEALDKLKHGMKILIREGSAAKNFEALIPLMKDYYKELMFCSDDKHPDNLIQGHINQLVNRALAYGYEFLDVLTVASVNPVKHYGLDMGLLQVGDKADFLIADSVEPLVIKETWIDGEKVAEAGKALFDAEKADTPNLFNLKEKDARDFHLDIQGSEIRVIEALDGQLVTTEKWVSSDVLDENQTSVEQDVLKFAVVNRYADSTPAVAYITNFGLKEGAIASSVGHDSHNVLAVGVDDESIAEAVNLLVKNKGGVAAVGKGEKKVLPLPVAGLMSVEDGYTVGKRYEEIDVFAKVLGSPLRSPFMTLSFMALLVIPALKLSDKGLFDGEGFQFVPLCR
ncbi:adenine deaminase [Fulvivirga sediminis]|uniref:Adenine deaminase n=1 Tax=Fulvivirga sediminis TaxID=2803949 RepID=A0A937F7Q2_9BACT|nr:adenine deaminase [Fulvivirga sediminis]MBL3655618.1 adenine deaminase [Fulvivirga sediminis]